MPDSGTSTLFDDLREAVTAPDLTQAEALQLCRSGTLLRAMMLVIVVLGVGLMFDARSLTTWLGELSSAAAVAVPATLLWVLMACGARHLIAKTAPMVQVAAASALGAVAALALWWPMASVGMAPAHSTHAIAPALTGALLAALIFQSERWRQRARLPAAAAARLADLQTRIRPHFLFNTLNTAITLVQLDPKRAEEVLEDLSDLFRAALGALDQDTTVGAEIELSRRYLAIEQLRFGRRLDVEWDLDPHAAAAKLPPLALQPLIENAVRHGIEPADKGGTIEIRTRRRRDRVLISVTNTVARGPSKPGHGIGIASVRERLRLMHDLDADFRSGLTEDGRYRVSIGLPC
ncbi:histidine kinase [Ideonella sp. DXS29W]|uniref:Histidine kinase n=1 Tax=Ideonella lacteola TaxID=2984193 RepID=A0ABU9BRH4_9BURK